MTLATLSRMLENGERANVSTRYRQQRRKVYLKQNARNTLFKPKCWGEPCPRRSISFAKASPDRWIPDVKGRTWGRALKNAMLARGVPFVLSSMLSDSREDAKVKGTRKVGGEGKRKKEGMSEPGTGYVKNGWLFSVLIANPLIVKGTDFLEPSSSLTLSCGKKSLFFLQLSLREKIQCTLFGWFWRSVS